MLFSFQIARTRRVRSVCRIYFGLSTRPEPRKRHTAKRYRPRAKRHGRSFEKIEVQQAQHRNHLVRRAQIPNESGAARWFGLQDPGLHPRGSQRYRKTTTTTSSHEKVNTINVKSYIYVVIFMRNAEIRFVLRMCRWIMCTHIWFEEWRGIKGEWINSPAYMVWQYMHKEDYNYIIVLCAILFDM